VRATPITTLIATPNFSAHLLLEHEELALTLGVLLLLLLLLLLPHHLVLPLDPARVNSDLSQRPLPSQP
jgi:hypothetical protein